MLNINKVRKYEKPHYGQNLFENGQKVGIEWLKVNYINGILRLKWQIGVENV